MVIALSFHGEIEKILDHQVLGFFKKNRREKYLVQWKGSSEVDATWEKAIDLLAVQGPNQFVLRRLAFDEDVEFF